MSWNGKLGRVGTATAGDRDLGARDVELGSSTRVVDSDLFNTEKVITGGERRRNSGRVFTWIVWATLAFGETIAIRPVWDIWAYRSWAMLKRRC